MEHMAVAKGPQNNTPHKKHDATHPSGLASVEMSRAGWLWLFVTRRRRRKKKNQKNEQSVRFEPATSIYSGTRLPHSAVAT